MAMIRALRLLADRQAELMQIDPPAPPARTRCSFVSESSD